MQSRSKTTSSFTAPLSLCERCQVVEGQMIPGSKRILIFCQGDHVLWLSSPNKHQTLDCNEDGLEMSLLRNDFVPICKSASNRWLFCAEGGKETTVLSGGRGREGIRWSETPSVCLSAAAAVGKVVQILASWLGCCYQMRYSLLFTCHCQVGPDSRITNPRRRRAYEVINKEDIDIATVKLQYCLRSYIHATTFNSQQHIQIQNFIPKSNLNKKCFTWLTFSTL